MAKWPKLKRDYKGMKVRSTKLLRNGRIEVPQGTVMTILDWYRGASVKTDPCPHCGVRVYITKVAESDMEPMEEEA